MIVLNTEGFSDEFKDTAPKECAIYLSSCLSEDTLPVASSFPEEVLYMSFLIFS